jgi:hypothetical protein
MKNSKKPEVKLTGNDSNIFNLFAICSRALRSSKQQEKIKEMQDRIFKCDSYPEALSIMKEYCEIS